MSSFYGVISWFSFFKHTVHSTENIYSSVFQYLNEKAMTGTSMFHRGLGETSHGGGTEVTSIPLRAEGGDRSANCKPLKHIISIYENGQDVHGNLWKSVCDADSVVWKISSFFFKRGAACKHWWWWWYADELLTLQKNIVNNDKTITASDFSSKHEDEKHDLIYARHKKTVRSVGLYRIELTDILKLLFKSSKSSFSFSLLCVYDSNVHLVVYVTPAWQYTKFRFWY